MVANGDSHLEQRAVSSAPLCSATSGHPDHSPPDGADGARLRSFHPQSFSGRLHRSWSSSWILSRLCSSAYFNTLNLCRSRRIFKYLCEHMTEKEGCRWTSRNEMNWVDVPGVAEPSSFQGGICLILGSVPHNIVEPSGITCMRISPQHGLASSPSSDGLG